MEDRKILILDEATSSLDQFNERRVLDLLNKRKSQALIIQISHRKQVIECADQIIDLEKFKNIIIKRGSNETSFYRLSAWPHSRALDVEAFF